MCRAFSLPPGYCNLCNLPVCTTQKRMLGLEGTVYQAVVMKRFHTKANFDGLAGGFLRSEFYRP
ncbi:hypothetical protein H206_02199 [Candidatus Electrothrix aarhusensis]|uniref:Uncharacterized protein n=1 Tax=Candidatus Electrothrix aarhusensis TaxID=1859131 RepID=A0A444IWN3_9BACT|nr:hypothetical protein H206_02199 [Candidatus Electrothrix aarhusensis]